MDDRKDITVVDKDSAGKETSRQVVKHGEGGGLAAEKVAKIV
jgi:hypothetical protein